MKKIITTLFIISILFVSQTINSQWVISNAGIPSNTGVSQVSFPDVNTGYAAVSNGTNGFIFKTTDAASSWVQAYSISGETITTVCFINTSTGFAGGNGGKIYNTINGGQNWTFQSFTGYFSKIYKIKFLNSTTGYAVGDGSPSGPIMKTTNGGINWTGPVSGASSHIDDIFFVDMNTGYTGGDFDISKTTNGGNTWSILFHGVSGNPEYWSVFFINANTGYFSHSQGGYKYTTDGGTSFTNIILDTTFGTIFSGVYFTDPSNGYMTTFNMVNINQGKVYKTTNAGVNWNIQLNLANYVLYSVNFLNSSTGYITGGYYTTPGLIYKTSNGGGPIGIKPISSEIPENYSLSQNYPNPFNPSTDIKFDVSKSENVKITIYDALGKEVTTLVNEQLKPGTYQVEWNASNYSSGIYFYKFITENFSETKKMILIK